MEKSHGTFITGLEFLPTSPETDPIRGFSDASVVIIFIPKNLKLHSKNFFLLIFGLKFQKYAYGIHHIFF